MTVRTRDATAAAFLLLGSVLYIYLWPRDFYPFDEGIYLYEAKRVLDGDVMYRDFFEILMPGWFYFMASLYAVFGVSLETARMSMAVVHGLIGVLTYATCRHVGVRPSMAAWAGLTHLTLGYGAHWIASAHWLAALVAAALLLVVLRRPPTTAWRALQLGVLSGLLVLVQQQKAAMVTAGILGVILVDQSLGGERGRWAGWVRQPLWYLTGVVGVVAPVLLIFIVAAGIDDVLRALVWHPLFNYRRIHYASGVWGVYFSSLIPGGGGAWAAAVPGLGRLWLAIQYLPLAVPVAGAVVGYQWWAKTGTPHRRSLLVLIVFSVGGLLSVAYNPNPIHFVFVMASWVVLAALLLELLMRTITRYGAAASVVTTILTWFFIAGMVWQLQQRLRLQRRMYPISTHTAFGRLDLAGPDDAATFKWVVDHLEREQVKEVFFYPCNAGFYLLTGTTNPTRYQFVAVNYTDRDQFEEIVSVLESRRTQLVIHNFCLGFAPGEPLTTYIRQHYKRIGPPIRPGVFPSLRVLQRRDDGRREAPTSY